MNNRILCLPLVVYVSTVCSAPVVPEQDFDFVTGVGDAYTAIYSDSEDENTYYIPPKRVDIDTNLLSSKKLFKVNFSNETKAGEIMGLLRLEFDKDRVDEKWQSIVAQNPNAGLSLLPIEDGVFGMQFDSNEFNLLIGRGSKVNVDHATGTFPLYIRINETGLDAMRLLSTIPNGNFLTIDFEYNSYRHVPDEKLIFSFTPDQLLDEMLNDDVLADQWALSDLITQESLKRFLKISFANQIWFASGSLSSEFNLNRAVHYFIARLDEYVLNQVAIVSINTIRDKRAIEALRSDIESGGLVNLSSIVSGQQLITDTASLGLKGICDENSGSVYVVETGESECFTIDSGGDGGDGDDDIWFPFGGGNEGEDEDDGDFWLPF